VSISALIRPAAFVRHRDLLDTAEEGITRRENLLKAQLGRIRHGHARNRV
jgi:hypothetical protein